MTDVIRVLVVDDSVTIRAMLTRVLQEDRRIVVTSAKSADEADILLARQAFDVVTLDVEMPGMGGIVYLRRMSLACAVPVVMLSASMGRGGDQRSEALRAGAFGCFDKADAVREAKTLIRMVRDAAAGRRHLSPEDRATLATRGEDG